MIRDLRKGDYFIFIIIAMFGTLFFILNLRQSTSNELLVQISSPSGDFIYPLDTELTKKIEFGEHYNIIEINANGIRIKEADCENQIGVLKGYINKSGEWIACLPHKLFIRISNSKNDFGIDAEVF